MLTCAKFRLLTTMALLSLLCAGCQILQPVLPSENKPLVGVILPFSSAYNAIALEQKQAIQMALADQSDAPRILFADGGPDAAGARKAFHQLMQMQPKPMAIISCASWAATEINPLAAEKKVFHLAIGSAAFHRAAPGYTVRLTLDVQKEEHQLGNFLSRFQKIAIFYMDNDYGSGWEKALLKTFGNRIVASIPYNPLAADFAAALQPITHAAPDALLLLSADNAGKIARQAREMGIDAQLVGTRPIERPKVLRQARYTNGLVYTYPSYNTRHPMIQRYQDRYNEQPTIFACEAYDAIQSLVLALKETEGTANALFNWYAGWNWVGALGEVQFDAQGDAQYPYLYKEIRDGAFRVADFQFPFLLNDTHDELHHVFHEMLKSVEAAAEELGKVGLTGPRAQEILLDLHQRNSHSYDTCTINTEGVIMAVAPQKYAEGIVGADISHQEQVQRMLEKHKPVVSTAIDTVEGFVGFDLEHPIFNPKGEFIGSVSILTEPDFFGNVIRPKVANFPVEIWMMQKDGRIIYDDNEEEIGLNLFTNPLYADFDNLRKIGQKMAREPEGEGGYEFYDKRLRDTVIKKILWTTITLHGTEFRLALAWVPENL